TPHITITHSFPTRRSSDLDQAGPNQPATLNLRGEILMEQKEFEEAEAAFKKAAKLDPKFREAQYNLAQIPFKKKDYAKARERFKATENTSELQTRCELVCR